jgi:hypothetical protein
MLLHCNPLVTKMHVAKSLALAGIRVVEFIQKTSVPARLSHSR